MKLKTSKYVIAVPVKTNELAEESDRLLFSTRSGGILRISKKYLDLIYAHNYTILPDPLFNLLVKYEMIVFEAEDETKAIIKKNISFAKDKKKLSATLLLIKILQSV